MAQNYYESFKKKLEEIFMMDHAELDFGIYRIMNQKRNDIQHFLDQELLPQVQKVLEGNSGNTQLAKQRMTEIEQMFAGMDIETLPASNPHVAEYQKLKAQLAQGGNAEDMEGEVFSHLVTFFSRYYDGGDFLSKRRYKENTYAIPYNGEEVKMHWANSDQYYIKTSEYFRDYTFVLPTSRKKVHFVLKDANTEQNNNKAANNMERRFALLVPKNEEPVTEKTDEGDLNIYFTYELMPKTVKQDALRDAAVEAIKPLVPEGFEELLTVKSPTAKDPNRTLLEKHLTDYTAKNSFDYFIHKDLGGFLLRELDFYIKNEVLHIDDLDPKHINSQLSIVKAIKQVGEKIIRMLAQLENFQRKLWLKKKFVVQSEYCITLDRVPEELYPEIIANEAQRKEWVRLFAIDEIQEDLHTVGYSEPLTTEFLKQNHFLVLDTAFFDTKFKHKLVACMDNIDEQTNGLLINSENFQALGLLQEKLLKRVKCVYIDPPYNAPASEVLYKNSFKHSAWISMMDSRLNLSKRLLTHDGSHCIAIDKYEHNNLFDLCKLHFSDMDIVSVAIEHNKKGTMGDHFSFSNEYAIFAVSYNLKHLNEKTRKKEDWDYSNLRNWGGESERGDAANCFYPIYVRNNKVIGYGDVLDDTIHPSAANEISSGKFEIHTPNGDIMVDDIEGRIICVWPIDPEGVERKWRYAYQSISEIYDKLIVENGRDGSIQIKMPKFSDQFKTLWAESIYNAGDNGTKVLTALGFTPNDFAYPKSIYTVKDCVYAISDKESIVLDYFAGSGTTAQSVLKLNAEDKGHRKYFLCEMGNYFKTVTKPRVEKIIYSADWRDGKPISRNGISQCFKYIRLEQYEDTLNNLEIKKQQTEFQTDDFQESYMLSYMLETETRDSLLNLKWFVNPFNMSLKTTKDNELVPTKVDLIETFNFLIGLYVETEDWYKDDQICVVQGRTNRQGLKTLVIWRNCEIIDNQALCDFFDRMDFRTRDSEFDIIYVNGDNTLPNLRRDEESWKVVLIEEEFAKRMFEEE